MKRVLITGATGGIGKPLCLYLSKMGYELILAARDVSKLEALNQEINSSGGKSQYAQIDFSDSKTFQNLKNFCEQGISGLVVMPPQLEPTAECLPQNKVWEDSFRNSFIGPVDLIRETIPFLRKSTPSKVVIISGISSAQVLSHYATSNVVRTMWLAQAKTLAFAFGPEKIHFNTLSLGGVLTEKYKQRLQNLAKEQNISFEQIMEKQVDNVPLRKYADTQDIAKAIEGLLSSVTDHITGMNIMCDGGFTRSY